MKTKLIIDGNAVYEVDQECMERRRREKEEQERKRKKAVKKEL